MFGGGVVYSWFQTYLSHRMLQCAMNTRKLCLCRLMLSIFGSIFFVSFLILFYYATRAWNDPKPPESYALWKPENPGYTLHVISSVAEWLCAICVLLMFLSFAGEFNKIKIGFSVRRHDVNILPFQISTEEQQPLVYA